MHHSNRGLPTKPTFEDNEICENLKRHSGYGWGGGGWTPDRLAGYTHFDSTVFSYYTEAIVSVVT